MCDSLNFLANSDQTFPFESHLLKTILPDPLLLKIKAKFHKKCDSISRISATTTHEDMSDILNEKFEGLNLDMQSMKSNISSKNNANLSSPSTDITKVIFSPSYNHPGSMSNSTFMQPNSLPTPKHFYDQIDMELQCQTFGALHEETTHYENNKLDDLGEDFAHLNTDNDQIQNHLDEMFENTMQENDDDEAEMENEMEEEAENEMANEAEMMA